MLSEARKGLVGVDLVPGYTKSSLENLANADLWTLPTEILIDSLPAASLDVRMVQNFLRTLILLLYVGRFNGHFCN